MQAKLFFGAVASLLVLAGNARADDETCHCTPTGSFAIGAGYNTDDGFGAQASVTQTDLFHMGKLLSLDAMIDAREQRFVMRYSDPEFLGTSLQLDALLFNDTKHFDGFWHDRVGSQVGLSKLVAPHLKMYGAFVFEHDTDTVDDGITDPNLQAAGYDVASLRAGLEYNTLNAPPSGDGGATRGTRIGSYLEVGSPSLGGEQYEQFIHTRSYGETHHALVGGLRVNAYGSFETMDAGENGYLYPGQLLQFDGSSQLRGYAPNTFGPVDGDGMHTGANMAAFGRVELEHSLFGHSGLSGVAFLDGGVMANAQRQGEAAMTTGFGIVWHSPIGPIGGYWAWDKLSGKPSFVFGVGSMFGQN
ncbi:MAG: BamA/TamA family outer membrane protein [Kofleriaceae bacterium]